ncbi:MAG: hypothetical protein U1E39_06700 [Planctomycetota bacterium]
MPPDRDLPTPVETRLAYVAALLSTFVWVAAVMPGVLLADRALADDLASTMHRGAVYLVPTLLLVVAMPVAAVIARRPLALRGLLAWSSVFVATYTACALWAASPSGFRVVVAVALTVVAVAAVRDAVVLGRAGADDADPRGPRTADVRLAVSLLALLLPAGLLATGHDEQATWLVPFVFLAVAAAGERFGATLGVLRATAVLCLVTLALHLVVGVRYALDVAAPPSAAWTAWGAATFSLSVAVLACFAGWGVVAALRMRLARAPEPTP